MGQADENLNKSWSLHPRLFSLFNFTLITLVLMFRFPLPIALPLPHQSQLIISKSFEMYRYVDISCLPVC